MLKGINCYRFWYATYEMRRFAGYGDGAAPKWIENIDALNMFVYSNAMSVKSDDLTRYYVNICIIWVDRQPWLKTERTFILFVRALCFKMFFLAQWRMKKSYRIILLEVNGHKKTFTFDFQIWLFSFTNYFRSSVGLQMLE